MSLVKWAIFGLLMLPFVEIAVFVAVALKLGFLAALALMILTSLAGMAVIRNAGHGDVARMRTAFGERTITSTVPISIYEVHLGSWRRVPEERIGHKPSPGND